MSVIKIRNEDGEFEDIPVIKGENGDPGPQGPPGADATINGVNALTLQTANGISSNQSGGTLTIKLPDGGDVGDVLKRTATGAQWDDVPSDIPAGGTQGQVLTKGDGETVTWSDPASGLPDGGTPGQMLYQGESGAEWGDKPDAGSVAFTPGTTGLTSTNVQDAIEEVNGKTPLVVTIYYDAGVAYTYVSSVLADDIISEFDDGKPVFLYDNDKKYTGDLVAMDRNAHTVVFGGFKQKSDGCYQYVKTTIQQSTNAVAQSFLASAPTSRSTTITLTTSGWTGSAAPYSQQVSCSIVEADTAVVAVDVDTPGTDADADAEAINAWALCTQQNPTQGAGTLTFYATEKPTINIPVKVGVA